MLKLRYWSMRSDAEKIVLDLVDTFSIFRSYLKTASYFFSHIWYMSSTNICL